MTAAARTVLAAADISVRTISLPSFAAAFAAGLAIIGAETWAAFGHLIECERLGADVRTRLLASRAISSAEVAAAESVRRIFRAEIDEVLSHVDALALPTLPDLPLSLAAAADARAALHSSSFVRPFNLSGHPALTLPITVQGLPAGLQLVGRAGEDEALCALATMVVGKASAAGRHHVDSRRATAAVSAARRLRSAACLCGERTRAHRAHRRVDPERLRQLLRGVRETDVGGKGCVREPRSPRPQLPMRGGVSGCTTPPSTRWPMSCGAPFRS